MPVPDQARDDDSGIQKNNNLKTYWIPGQARNDITTNILLFLIATQSLRGYDAPASSLIIKDLSFP